MWMNVVTMHMIVMSPLTAPTPLEAFNASVMLDTLEMALLASVKVWQSS